MSASFSFTYLIYLQISAEEIKDNRVVLFEMEARKLDNKVGRFCVFYKDIISFFFFF